jgi:phage shock protein PspC (stress-responsive transcriptional regulator)
MARKFSPVDESLFKTEPCITRYPETILSRKDVPYRSALTFNAGVLKRENGEYIMIFRNDIGDYDKQILEGTNLGLAFSKDGLHWNVEPEPCFAMQDDEIMRVYDPRITEIDGEYCMCFAVDTKHGVCGGMAKYFGIDPTIIRLIWALATVFAFAGLVAYIVCALVIPEEQDDFVEVQ